MSGNKFSITPKIPTQLTGTWPIVVDKSGLNYNVSFALGDNCVSKRQFFSAVKTVYTMATLYAAISANPESDVWCQFFGGSYVAPGDPIATLTQSTFTLTDVQMANLFLLASTLDY